MKDKSDGNRKWILIRGLSHESAHWMDFYPFMRDTFSHDSVKAIDLMGTGVHYRQASPLTIKELAEKAREDALKWAEPPYFLLSLSMGAMVAYEWENNFPGDVRGLVLMNPSFKNLSPFYKRLRWEVYPELIKSEFTRDPIVKEKRFLKIISQNEDKHEEEARKRAKIRKLRPVTLANKIRQTIAASRYSADYDAPKVPTLLLSGKGDRIVDPGCSDAVAKAWKVPHFIHPWAGHDLSLDDPEWVMETIGKWLKEQGL